MLMMHCVWFWVFLDELTFGESLKWPLIVLQLLAQWCLLFSDNPTIFTDVTTSVDFLKMTKKMLQTD